MYTKGSNILANFEVLDLDERIVVIGLLGHAEFKFVHLFYEQWLTVYGLVFNLHFVQSPDLFELSYVGG